MTRKEEREQFAAESVKGADKLYGYKYSIKDVECGIQQGAEWADETMLDNVCEYLKKLVYQEYPGGPLVRRIDDEELKNLRKAMMED